MARKSEQLDANQLEFLMGKLQAPDATPASGVAATPEAEPARRTRSPRQPRYPEHLPVETEIIDPAPVLGNPDAWRQIGEEASDLIDYEPGRFLLRCTVRRVWVKSGDPDAVPVIAPRPPKLLKRGILAPGLLAHVLVGKYGDHLPLCRQERIFNERYGVHLPRQTLARGVELAATWRKPIVEQIRREQLASGYLQIDETPVKYLEPGQGQTSQGYFWTVHVPKGDTVYHWTAGRGHEHLLEILPETFEGRRSAMGTGRTGRCSRSGPG